MQAQARSRKRGADANATDASYTTYPQQTTTTTTTTTAQDGGYGANDLLNPYRDDGLNNFGDIAAFDNTVYYPPPSVPQAPTGQAAGFGPSAAAPPSNQLVRRSTNHQVARTPQRNQWNNFSNSAERVWEDMEHEEEQDLDQKAAIAKKDAQAKRKQIPPFVQKLSSFLDSSNNTELIRWSDDGNSFIVLDEDEFARTLIPELFKHNNYASFVRQLNMYGFHKKVGLNANSMKAAEKKVKDPSVYWHEYFKRGRPDLLWLIQKPAAKTSSAKRKRDQGKSEPGDSEDEQKGGSPDVADAAASLMTTVPRQDMGTFRTELQKLQRQQGVISKMITSLKDQNEQFYRQATAFQALHDRHENSINAILTFLATFYNRSLDGHAGSPNLASFLSSASIPQQAQQQGSVFDMGDGDMTDSNNANNLSNQQLQRYQKPRPLLLHAPGAQTPSPSPFTNGTPSVRSSTSPGQDIATHPGPPTAQPAHQAHHQTQHGQAQTRQQAQYGPQAPPSRLQTQPQHTQRASVTPFIKDDAPTPDLLHQYPENDDVMNLINNVNASNSPSNGDIGPPTYDYALGHIQDHNNNNNTLTAQQRQDVLSLIAASGATGAGATAAQPGANNALMMPNPPPALDQFRQTKEQLDMLTKLQSEQDIKVQDLAGRLQPLSPTGAIPGITASNFDELGNPGDFDLSSYINDPEDGYFGDFADIGGGVSSAPGQQASSSTTFAAGPVPNDDDMGFDWSYAQHGNNNNGLDDTEDLFGESRVDGIDAKAGPSVQQDEGVGGMGRVVGSVSSADTSPGQTDVVDEDETPSKRLRMG